MRKITLGLLLCALAVQTFAVRPPLKGFAYGSKEAPTGKEWESPEELSLNKELPRAWFFSFQDVDNARKVLPENSKYWQSLNGDWKFNWAPDPDSRPKDFFKPGFDVSSWDNIPVPSNWNVYGIQKNGDLKYGVPIYCNQPVIFKHTVKVDDWRGGVMRTPDEDWVTFKHRNEIGSHRRDFTVPKDWDGREVFISFDGVDSFFYIWINGKYVGFSKNSRNAARFNITQYLQEGNNTVAVEVYRSSDGSFLEAQDMFRLPGIFRTVALYSTPKVQINDLVAIPELDANYENGSLEISAEIRNYGKKDAKKYTVAYSLFENELYSDENSKVENATATAEVGVVESDGAVVAKASLKLDNPNKWSAEFPYRYVLVAELKDGKGKTIETVSTYVGFREVEIRDTPASEDEFGLAGRYYYVNGETVKLKGVNRHETSPTAGHVLSREEQTKEVMIMKRANINHVRNSHYPPDPYWFYLSDKYGLYLEDEANIESHQYFYGKPSLSHPIEWENAHVGRVMEMAHSTVNAPSVVIWSLGNEAGPGKNFVSAYNALKAFDKSRPVQYERNNSIVDMGSNQYPSIASVRDAVKGQRKNVKYPFHISEYAHSMGNACGNLEDYWEAIESTNFFCGAAIWDWIDQSIYNYEKDGTRYLAYGGDFGDKPNSGQFVMNGIIFADMEPKPQYYEVKKVYQHIDVDAVDVEDGTFEVFNKYYFHSLDAYKLRWSLYENGSEVKSGFVSIVDVPARTRKAVSVPYGYGDLNSDSEYFVKFQFLLKENQPWADAGFVQADEQIFVKAATDRPSMLSIANRGRSKTGAKGDIQTITGDNFEVKFDKAVGTIHSLKYGDETIIEEGDGPKLDVMRAQVNNDRWFFKTWFENGLHNLKHKTTSSDVFTAKDGRVIVTFAIESQAPNAATMLGGKHTGTNIIEEIPKKKFGKDDLKFTTRQVWTIYKDGSIELQSNITSNKPKVVVPRLGYTLEVPKEYSNFSYYGRGPIGNYADRKSGQFIEEYNTTVAEQFVNFPKPQDMANHEDVRWTALTNKAGDGAIFIATDRLSVAALQHTAVDMTTAPHPHRLAKVENTYLRLDAGTTGLGGSSCGPRPLNEDMILAGNNNVGFIIRPVTAKDKLSRLGNVTSSGVFPIPITRDRSSVLNIVEASSEEHGSGDASNIIDGDPNTIWETAHSVTLAKHPHWLDIDLGAMKEIKGFKFTPRKKGSDGRIKNYTIQVSLDSKNWGKVIHKGAFDKKPAIKEVFFNTPAKARYIRFTAVDSHGNQDLATGAEIIFMEL